MVMVLSCIDIVEVILGDWRDTGAVLERMKISKKFPWLKYIVVDNYTIVYMVLSCITMH